VANKLEVMKRRSTALSWKLLLYGDNYFSFKSYTTVRLTPYFLMNMKSFTFLSLAVFWTSLFGPSVYPR